MELDSILILQDLAVYEKELESRVKLTEEGAVPLVLSSLD